MKILNINRLDDSNVELRLEDRDQHFLIGVEMVRDGDLRGIVLRGISSDDKWRLYNSPESIDLTHQLWKFFDGEPLSLPLELRANVKSGVSPVTGNLSLPSAAEKIS